MAMKEKKRERKEKEIKVCSQNIEQSWKENIAMPLC